MTKRDWWLGIVLLCVALLVHGVLPYYLPRHEWRSAGRGTFLRIDRWTGQSVLMVEHEDGHYRQYSSAPTR